MKIRLTLVWFAFLIFGATEGHSNPHWGPTRCGHFSSHGFPEKGGTYCMFTTGGSTNQDVVYYFHGIMGSEEEWYRRPQFAKVRSLWAEQGLHAPIVVGISFGPGWMIAPKEAGKKGGLYELIMQQYIPFIERELIGSFKGRRILLGASMGGFNALQLFVRQPQFFSKVMLMCPAISTTSPWDDRAVAQFLRSGRMPPAMAKHALGMLRSTFSSHQSWLTHSPLTYLQRNLSSRHLNTPVYIQVNKKDELGFTDAHLAPLRSFVDRYPSNWVFDVVPGRHCEIDHVAASHFFQQ